MNETQNLNLSLLSQNEIDTLVGFLSSKSKSVDSSVLNQSSIDKLIQIIQYDNRRRKQDAFMSYADLGGSLKEAVTVRTEDEPCEMLLARDGDAGRIHITVKNTVNGQSMEITPAIINDEDGDSWGRSIPPVLFCRLALALDVKYSAATYESVCKCFAENIFGDEDHTIPFLYLPENQLMLENLI